jgi:hypothetical protein
MMRNKLPDRRRAETRTFEHAGAHFRLTLGFFPDGRVGELFLNHDHCDSALDALAQDAAILASLALQLGGSIEVIRHALKRNRNGVAATPIGAAIDLIEEDRSR